MRIPTEIAGQKVFINVVDNNLPLLLSKGAIKQANVLPDFSDDAVNILGKKEKLLIISSAHYCVPFSPRENLIKHDMSDNEQNIALFIENLQGKSKAVKLKIAEKLHRQFSHPRGEKLKFLVRDAGTGDIEFSEIISNFESSL